MNQFVIKFGERIKGFLKLASEEQKKKLLEEIVKFANSDPQSFQNDLEEVQFDRELTPLPVVLEALSKETDNWGQLYVDILDSIFEKAKQSDKPQEILSNLLEFCYIEKDHRPFIQRVVDRLSKEIDSDNLPAKLAAIWTLPAYLTNDSVRNKSLIIASLEQKLYDKNWKVRYITFKSLEYEGLLPSGHTLLVKDKFLKLIFGTPSTV